MITYQSIQHKEAMQRGDKVQMYLEEKLSPGQIFYDPTLAHQIAYHMHPNSYAIWFRVYTVPTKYWNSVVRSGIEDLVKQLDCVIYYTEDVVDGAIEFWIDKENPDV